jgi:multiple sugar transport system substrate-binding protein
VTKAPVTLRWSTWGDANSPMVQAAEQGLALFRTRFPTVTVMAEPQVNTPNGPVWADKHMAEWLAGTGPDLSGNNGASLLDWGRQGILLNVDPLAKRDGKQVPLSDYVPAYLGAFRTTERGLFALPMYMGIIAIVFSRTLFQKKGVMLPDNTWDWDKLQDAMRRLTTVSENANESTFGYLAQINFAQHGYFIHQSGGHQVDPQDSRKAVFHTPEALRGIQWLHDRTWKDKSLPTDAEVTSLGFKAPQYAVAAGRLGMTNFGSQNLASLVKELPDAVRDWDVMPMPRGPVQKSTGHTFDGWGVWSGGKHLDVAWELDKFLQSDAWVEIAASVVGLQPSRKSWQDKYLTLLKQQYPALADKNLAAYTDPIRGEWAHPNEYYFKNTEAQKIWKDAATATFATNQEPVADAFRKAANLINQLHGV